MEYIALGTGMLVNSSGHVNKASGCLKIRKLLNYSTTFSSQSGLST
jgi:hypothetical protein